MDSLNNNKDFILNDSKFIDGLKSLLEFTNNKSNTEINIEELKNVVLSLFHELKNPLNSAIAGNNFIIKFLPILDNSNCATEELENAYKASHLTREGLYRINNLVSYYQADLKKEELDHTDFCFNEGVKSSIAILQEKIKKNKVVIANYIKDIPIIQTIPGQIEQVISNLILNSIEAMPNGGELRISSEPDSRNIKLFFSDTGSGISKQDLEFIFEPYFTTKYSAENCGLGLHISRKIIRQHGGELIIENNTAGTVFILQLPIKTQFSN